MKKYDLNIADYVIRVETDDEQTNLVPAEKFRSFMTPGGNANVTIKVYAGSRELPADAELVFNAPYVEEVRGMQIKKSDDFWKVWKSPESLYITCTYPYSSSQKRSVLRFSPGSSVWNLSIDGTHGQIDPLEYPLDGLILYYLTAISKDIFIHASGALFNGKGYLFSGVSGRGKTTMAKLWDNTGAKIIHDDRLIIRKDGAGYSMHNTPVYRNETPASARLDHIFLLEHSVDNEIIPLSGAAGVSQLMANCIQHSWNRDILDDLLGSVSGLCRTVPVSILRFRPDSSIISEILADEQNRK